MVNENLQTSTVLEWLLGSGWYTAWLWQPMPVAVMLVLLLLVLIFGVRWLRSGNDAFDPNTAFTFGALVGIFLLIADGPWFAIVVRMTTPDTKVQGAIDTAFVPIESALNKVLGSGWQDGTVYMWLFLIWSLFAIVFQLAWVFRTVTQGPGQALTECGRALLDVGQDLARMSPRRVLALGWLAWRESLRRRVWVVFAVFVFLVMFAGWFLQTTSDHPAQLYIQFVLNWTIYLTLVFALILSALSLPQDIQDRTVHTIVTKPVRKLELLLGRLLGFTAMGTVLLVGIGLLSYWFIKIGLNHYHEIAEADLQSQILPGQKPILHGLTTLSHGHRHEVKILPSGEIIVEPKFDHTHEMFKEQKNGVTVYRSGPPEGLFSARVPIYARSLTFTDPHGDPGKGVNVGDEWMYRSFIAGATQAAGIWTFQINAADYPESKYPTGIPIEMTIEPFRTHKGDLERGVLGSLWVRNPETKLKVTVANFQAKKFATDTQYIPFVFPPKAGAAKNAKPIDFFRDIVTKDGTFEVGLQCLEHAQYFGMAQPDLYIRASDASFAFNFFKGYIGIWMQMVMILSIGLFWSTFLSGPVGMLGTLAAIVAGFFRPFIYGIAVATVVGGGPFEAYLRMLRQDNEISQLKSGLTEDTAVVLDKAARFLLHAVASVLPPFTDFDLVKNVAFGFDINQTMLTKCLFSELGYVVPVLLLAYFCLRGREIAR